MVSSEPSSSAGSPPRVLVLTLVRDEGELLQRWVAHYAAQVGAENLLVLDDNSSDGSTREIDCPVHLVPGLPDETFEKARMRLVSGIAGGFLAAYDVVVFVDADEFLVADPRRHRDLRSFLAARPERRVIAPLALNIVHGRDEAPLRPDLPVLGQRRYASFAPVMCKPNIKRVSARWYAASHGIMAPFEIDPDLYLIHLKFADRDQFRRRTVERNASAAAGRGRLSNWSRAESKVTRLVDRAVTVDRQEAAVEFDSRTVDLGQIVQPDETPSGGYRSVGMGQLEVLRRQPLHRVPEFLMGCV